jgi:hypothetical protein
MENIGARISIFCRVIGAKAVLAVFAIDATAQTMVPKPITPKVIVTPPISKLPKTTNPVTNNSIATGQQQPLFGGVRTILQQKRDRLRGTAKEDGASSRTSE